MPNGGIGRGGHSAEQPQNGSFPAEGWLFIFGTLARSERNGGLFRADYAFTEPKRHRTTSEELGAIMKGINSESPSGKGDAALIALAYCGGLRRQEIASLQLENVNDLGEEFEITIKAGKGRKDRVLFLNNGAADALKDYLSVRGDSSGFLFWASRKNGKLLENSKLTDQAVYARIKRVAEVAGVKTFSPHDMRRSFVSDMLDAGVDISTAAVGRASGADLLYLSCC